MTFFQNSVKEPDLHEINEKKCQFHHFLKATKSQKVFLIWSHLQKNEEKRIKKLVKTLMDFFRKFAILTENPMIFM